MAVALRHLAGRTIAVFGLARSGLATVRAAAAGGAAGVLVWDDRAAARQEAEALGGRAVEPAAWPWTSLDSLILSPGVPLTHPEPHAIVRQARAAGVEIVSDIELLYRELAGPARGAGARIVAVTGTNGKSTTTALIGHVLAKAGLKVSVGGNIGRGALDLEAPEAGRVYVIEMSSYQLDLTARFRPDVAIWLNLTPDHLDRHGDMAGYTQAKMRIFANMTASDTALVGVDDEAMKRVAATLRSAGRTVLRTVSCAAHSDADLRVNSAGLLYQAGQVVASFAGLAMLRGAHNWQNAAMAWGAARALGLDSATIMAAMASFPGLAHRTEILGRRGRVLFVNDSKATNADAAAKALAAFEPIYWIAGGQAKDGGIESLAEHFDRIAKAYLIGAAADAFSHTLARRVPHMIAGDLETAVRFAAKDAAGDDREEPVVLLSPACASFDQFADFEQRGEAFRSHVAALDAKPMEAFA